MRMSPEKTNFHLFSRLRAGKLCRGLVFLTKYLKLLAGTFAFLTVKRYAPKAYLFLLGESHDITAIFYPAPQGRPGLLRGLRLRLPSTPFQPAWEREDAQRLAHELGVPLTVVELDVLACPQVAANPANRCYHCKKALFSALWQQVRADGFSLLLDGTNASDDAQDRPGMRALSELEVRSPLRACGLTKADVRRLSKEAGLFTWDKPAYACLATRIPTGTAITAEELQKVERAETALHALGFRDFRVRLFHGLARVQVPEGQMALALEQREEILAALGDFDGVLLDLKGR